MSVLLSPVVACQIQVKILAQRKQKTARHSPELSARREKTIWLIRGTDAPPCCQETILGGANIPVKITHHLSRAVLSTGGYDGHWKQQQTGYATISTDDSSSG